ncbi:WecB/TagA/CpsF family glycosyltransferase [Sinomonas flava]|uniref:WecB/TagA/CpsF family glycosyltransferase n=1 Tax=Sinomonas flava TaxID=496857 RepID=UPI0039A5DB1B
MVEYDRLKSCDLYCSAKVLIGGTMTTFINSRSRVQPGEWPAEFQMFAGLPIASSTPQKAGLEVCALASRPAGPATHIHFVNAYTLALADADREYAETLKLGINLPDGRPISIFSRLIGHNPVLNQVRGPEFFLSMFDIGRQFGVRHFLLGSTPRVLDRLQRNLEEKFPGCIIAGTESPPFRQLTPAEILVQDARIADARPDIIWVGLGTPKQDWEARRLADSIHITSIAVGAAFDFAAGTLREAPSWMSTLGVEWLFRLACEPRRLWRRYLYGNTTFLRVAVRAAIKARQNAG